MNDSNLPYRRRKKELDNVALSNQVGSTFEKMNEEQILKTIKKMIDGLSVKIVCYGDSMTFGWEPGTGNQVAEPYPLRLQTILRAVYNNENITVVNKGVGGWTSGTGLANLNSRVLAENPDLVIVMFGINDARQLVPISDFRVNMSSIVQQIRDTGSGVIVLSSTPIMDTTDNHHSLLLDYVKTTQEVADTFKVSYIDMYKKIDNLFFNGFENKFSLLADGIHFKNDKYRLIAEIVIGEVF